MSAARKLAAVPDPDRPRAILDELSGLLGIGTIEQVTQRGRDPQTAPYTLHMSAGQTVRIGTIKTLRSQPALGDVLAVTLGHMPPPIEAKLWAKMIGAVINHAVDVEETPGESHADRIRELLGIYTENAGTDRDGAMTNLAPFKTVNENGADVHVHAGDFAKWLDRQHGMKDKPSDLYLALADVGMVRRTIHYYRANKRGTRSYWVAPLDCLEAPDG